MLFSIFKCDLFLIMNKVDFASYADDNTPYVLGNGVKEAIRSLKEASDKLFYWFSNSQMVKQSNAYFFIATCSYMTLVRICLILTSVIY